MASPIAFHAVFVTGILSWFVALGGLAAVTKDCHNSNSIAVCASALQSEWWALWFEFFVLLAFTVLHTYTQLAAASQALLTFLAIVTSVLTTAASDILLSSSGVTGIMKMGLNAAAAGLVMLCVVNFVLILLLGTRAGCVVLGLGNTDGSRGVTVTDSGSQYKIFEMSSSTGTDPLKDSRHEVLPVHAQQAAADQHGTGVTVSW